MYNCISFFSNAGIGDIGVEKAGVKVKVANELLKERCETYKINHPNTEVLCGDINNLSKKDYLEFKEKHFNNGLFLLVATPPCQGVSVAGKRDKNDIRNQLIKPTVEAIRNLQSSWVWLENVPTYKNATIPNTKEIVEDDGSHDRINVLDFIKENTTDLGYKMDFKILDAKNYGVPQSRKRLIIIMTKTNKEISFPKPTYGTEKKPYKTVRNAIGHLPSLNSEEYNETDEYHFGPKHNPNHIKWITATPEGQTAFDNEKFEDRPTTIDRKSGKLRLIKAYNTTYRRMWWDKPASTVTMFSGNISSQNNVHPSDNRAMSVREVMILQSIPNNFKFPKGTSEKHMREMIGEAVPPLLSEKITEHIIHLHKKINK